MTAEVAAKLQAVKAIALRQYDYPAPMLDEDDCAELETAVGELEAALGTTDGLESR